jgi:hypothetical protein
MGTLRALVLGCSLKTSPAASSSELLGVQVLTALSEHDVDGEFVGSSILTGQLGFSACPDSAGP